MYLSKEDEAWVMRRGLRQQFWEGKELSLPSPDLVAIKTGGHFPGSSVLWWKSAKKLLVADSIMVASSGICHVNRPPGTSSFSFMWSYPNMVSSLQAYKHSKACEWLLNDGQIPLHPDSVHNIWKAIKDKDFEDVHGAFVGQETKGNSKKRVLDSAKIYVKAVGYLDHAIHQEA